MKAKSICNTCRDECSPKAKISNLLQKKIRPAEETSAQDKPEFVVGRRCFRGNSGGKIRVFSPRDVCGSDLKVRL